MASRWRSAFASCIPVVQLDDSHDFEGAALADDEIRDLAVELGADGPLRVP